MNLYRLDTVDGVPVRDWHGDFLARHFNSALHRARQEAAARRVAVEVTRIGKHGQTSLARVVPVPA